jgi:hypothetical protein
MKTLVAGGGFAPQSRIDSSELVDSTMVRNFKNGHKGKLFIQFFSASFVPPPRHFPGRALGENRPEKLFEKLFGARRSGHLYADGPHAWLHTQLKFQEGTTLPLRYDQFRNEGDPFLISENAEHMPIIQFPAFDQGGLELGKERGLTLAQFLIRQATCHRNLFSHIPP